MRVILGNVLAIYQKELRGYFASPLAYVVAGVFWLLSGLFFVGILDSLLEQSVQLDQQRQQFGAAAVPPFDVPYILLQNFLSIMASLSMVVLPILSMGLYSEERKRGTLELLATSPLTNWAVALGKLLGVLTFFVTLLVPVMVYEAIALSATDPAVPITILLISHLGLVLLAAGILSLGMFISSLTDSSIISAVFTFALVLVLWVINEVAKGIGGPVGEAIAHLSLLKHFTNLVQGIVDTSSLILFGSYIFLGLFLTAQSIEALRFQRS